MSSTKFILGLFEDPDEMMDGITLLQQNSVPIYDVYTPMPIHGIEAKLGIKDSRLGYAAFMFGCLGGTVIFSLVYYFMVHDWPMNIGGKPAFAAADRFFDQRRDTEVPVDGLEIAEALPRQAKGSISHKATLQKYRARAAPRKFLAKDDVRQ